MISNEIKNETENFFTLSHRIFEDESFKALKPSTRLFYVHLAKLRNRFGDKLGWFWRSSSQLAIDLKLTEKTIRAAKRQLIKDRYIEARYGEYEPEINYRHACWFRVNEYEKITRVPTNL
ncbi:MAG: hypothetical protein V2A70_08215 [Candidatus Omnitrophota bacterium]